MTKGLIADFWYPSSLNERHKSDLNSQIAKALSEAAGDRYIGIDGASFLTDDFDAPGMADNHVLVKINDMEEVEGLQLIIEDIINRRIVVNILK